MNKRELQVEITKIMDRVFREKSLSEFEKASLKNEIADLRSKMIAIQDVVVEITKMVVADEIEKISEESEEKPVKKKAKVKK